MDATANFYSRPSNEFVGAGFPIFSGSRRQRGGSILGSLKAFLMPELKRLGKSLMKRGLVEGVALAKDMAGDVFSGKNLKETIKQQGKTRAKRLGKEFLETGLQQATRLVGSGRRRKKRQSRKRRRLSVRRKPLRKRNRKRRAKSSNRYPTAKRRRKANF